MGSDTAMLIGFAIVVIVVFTVLIHQAKQASRHRQMVVELIDKVSKNLSDTSSRSELLRLLYSTQIPYNLRPQIVAWVANMIRDSATNGSQLDTAMTLANHLIPLSTSEASTLYQQSLKVLQASRGAQQFKELALRMGRLSYAAGRADRRPTIYDEQAIANDIAVRS